MNKKTVSTVSCKGKAVVVRVDYNVPLNQEEGVYKPVDDTRILQTLPTLHHILSQHPVRIVLVSHLGEPKGRDSTLSLRPVAQCLEKHLKQPVVFEAEYTTPNDRNRIKNYTHGEVVLLENTRFFAGETTNSKIFASQLASLGEVFVNDAFGCSHRAHASVVGIADHLPAVAGLLLEKELCMIGDTLEKPQSPFVVVLGGAKATTKIPVLERLFTKADAVLLGGGVANTFLRAMGYGVGRSVFSEESLTIAQSLIWRAARANTRLYLPSDVVVGSFEAGKAEACVTIDHIPIQLAALDIGSQTRKDYETVLSEAKTIIWNGPMGACEKYDFAQGTRSVLRAITKNLKAVSIVGGGDTLSSLQRAPDLDHITHISTGGGAMLEFIEKGTLPGVEVLEDR